MQHIHCIGIGGIGISALARMLAHEGNRVTGNDLEEFPMVSALRAVGIDTTLGTDPSVIPSGVDVIVYSIAWTTLAPHLLEHARTLGVPVLSYPEMLGKISQDKYTIAISGTHGKTTTTAMLAKICIDAGLDPTVIVGSLLSEQQSNFVPGKSKYFIVEACEYRRSFLQLYPHILVVTNIDDDHLDYYKDIADIQSAFNDLARRVPAQGFVVCDSTAECTAPALGGVVAGVRDYMTEGAPDGLRVPGEHNRSNARAALAVARILGIPDEVARASLRSFNGTWRRFEYKGTTRGGALVYDDYGHHPTEVEATLRGARELFPDKHITVVFQPHLYSRTKEHLEHFAQAFGAADEVIIAPIYAAREPADPTISSQILADKIQAAHAGTVSAPEDIASCVDTLTALDSSHVVITMGAGDINKLRLYV